jgi:hypothetical protein
MTDLLNQLADSPRHLVQAWFSTCAVIRDEEGEEITGPKPNILQRRMFDYYEECQERGSGCMMVILKPRRAGASTASQAILYHHGRRHPGVHGTLMGDKEGTSEEIYSIFRIMAENDRFNWNDGNEPLPPRGTPGNTDEDITIPGVGSRIGKETAGSKNAGRGGTRQMLNITECAHYKGRESDPTLALLPSCKVAQRKDSPRGVIIADSTPNGPQGWFWKTCMGAQSGKSRWKLIFAAWFEFDDAIETFDGEEEREAFIRSIEDPENAWLEEKREIEKYDGVNGFRITPEKLKYRRMMIETFCEGSVRKFRQEFPSSADECFSASAEKKFNDFRIKFFKDRIPSNLPRVVTMRYEEEDKRTVIVPDPAGDVKIFEEPRVGCRYLASGDFCTGRDQQIGGGDSDPDWHAIRVWRDAYYDTSQGKTLNAKLVCSYRSRAEIDVAAYTLAAISNYYGRCFIVPEVNNCGLEPTHILVKLGFDVYQRQKEDRSTGQMNRAHGWATDALTRKTIIDHFVRPWRQGEAEIYDPTDLNEIESFIVGKDGTPKALPGHHDDTVLANCIAYYNLSTCATPMREVKRKHPTLRQLRRNPRLMVPKGYMRGGFE